MCSVLHIVAQQRGVPLAEEHFLQPAEPKAPPIHSNVAPEAIQGHTIPFFTF